MPLTPYMAPSPQTQTPLTSADTLDSPYEMNLSRTTPRNSSSPVATTPAAGTGPADSPFTPGELERILRMYDIDASSLPDRLRAVLDPVLRRRTYAT